MDGRNFKEFVKGEIMFNQKEYMKQWRLDHKIEIAEKNKQWRLDYPEYVKQWHLNHPGYAKQWCLDHPEYHKQYAKQWYQDHKETENEKAKQWNLDHKKEKAEYSRQWDINHPEYHKQCFKRYRQTLKGKISDQRGKTKRRAREREIINTLTSQEWIDILKEYKFRCAYCGKEFTLFDRETKDHVIPISKGGDNTKENIVPACRSCNSKKGTKILSERRIYVS